MTKTSRITAKSQNPLSVLSPGFFYALLKDLTLLKLSCDQRVPLNAVALKREKHFYLILLFGFREFAGHSIPQACRASTEAGSTLLGFSD